MKDEITVEDIRDWQNNEITQTFFDYLSVHIADADKQVHLLLEQNQTEQAALSNAGRVQLEEVMAIPDRMVKDMKERE